MKEIRQLATDLLEKHEQNWDLAIEEGITIALSDPDILEEFTRPLISQAIRSIIQNIGQQHRSKIFNSSFPSVPTCPKGVSGEDLQKGKEDKAIVQNFVLAETIMDMWLNKCKQKLGNATKQDLAVEIDMYADNSRWNEKRYLFFKSIYEGLKSDAQTVRKAFTVKQLEALKQKAHTRADARWKRINA
jgi:hypothetical protein